MSKILPTEAEQRGLIDLARDKGFDVVDFLGKVMEGKHLAIGEPKPITLSLRLAAAELLRKYAALPTNVQLETTVTTKLEYVGDRDVRPVLPE